MEKNIGILDKILRVLLFLTMAALYFSNIIEGSLGFALMVLSIVCLITGLMSFCPVYLLNRY